MRTLGSVLQLKFNRIQFTPDLMPADILGTNLVAQTANSRNACERRVSMPIRPKASVTQSR